MCGDIMIYLQKWKEKTFENRYLKSFKNIIKEPKLNLYIGFDYGFFLGINIYYCNTDSFKEAKKINDSLKKCKQLIKLCTNIDVSNDYDIIILLGYSNLYKEKLRLLLNKKKILKALSSY